MAGVDSFPSLYYANQHFDLKFLENAFFKTFIIIFAVMIMISKVGNSLFTAIAVIQMICSSTAESQTFFANRCI